MARGILEVNLVDAKGLADLDAVGDMDPYVVIQYRSQERSSRVARGQGTTPKWNETFQFVVHSSSVIDSQHKLILRIMDQDTFTTDDFIGQASVNVADLISMGFEKGKAEMHISKHRVIKADQSYCGEIRVGVTFTAKVEDGGEEDCGGYRHSFND